MENTGGAVKYGTPCFCRNDINSRNQSKEETKSHELRHLFEVITDFTEESIQKRATEIMDAFLKCLSENELLK